MCHISFLALSFWRPMFRLTTSRNPNPWRPGASHEPLSATAERRERRRNKTENEKELTSKRQVCFPSIRFTLKCSRARAVAIINSVANAPTFPTFCCSPEEEDKSNRMLCCHWYSYILIFGLVLQPKTANGLTSLTLIRV